MPQLAKRMGRAKPSAIMAVAEKAKKLKAAGRDIVSFSIGVPNFLPGPHVYAAAREALDHDSGQYGSNRGSDALLDAFIAHMAKIGLTGYARVNCATGIGAKHVIYNLAEALLDEGDTIAFPVPYWTSYMDIAEIVDAKVDIGERFLVNDEQRRRDDRLPLATCCFAGLQRIEKSAGQRQFR